MAKNKIEYISLHHTGGLSSNPLASTQNLTAVDVDTYHKQKWNMMSTVGYHGGYNFFIDKNGSLTQFRAIGEETMAQRGYNYNTVSICLAGNFKADTPTQAQVLRLKQLMLQLVTGNFHGLSVVDGAEINIPIANVHPHRHYQKDTECNALPTNWGKNLLIEHIKETIGLLASIVVSLQQLILLLKRRESVVALSGDERSCNGFIN
jgi:hypothetical protein